jgi:hypothetical protein
MKDTTLSLLIKHFEPAVRIFMAKFLHLILITLYLKEEILK